MTFLETFHAASAEKKVFSQSDVHVFVIRDSGKYDDVSSFIESLEDVDVVCVEGFTGVVSQDMIVSLKKDLSRSKYEFDNILSSLSFVDKSLAQVLAKSYVIGTEFSLNYGFEYASRLFGRFPLFGVENARVFSHCLTLLRSRWFSVVNDDLQSLLKSDLLPPQRNILTHLSSSFAPALQYASQFGVDELSSSQVKRGKFAVENLMTFMLLRNISRCVFVCSNDIESFVISELERNKLSYCVVR